MDRQEQLTAGFRDVINKMSWLNGQKMRDAFGGFHASEVHCIEYIGSHADVNVTRLAEALYQTRGSISKITKKLMHKQIIEGHQKAGNKKEVYFRLTPQGESVYGMHAALHAEFAARDKAVFAEMTDAQCDSMLRFIQRYSRHLDAEIEKQGR